METLKKYTLALLGGQSKSMEDWGIEAAQVTLTNRGEDGMLLHFPLEITAAEIIPALSRVSLTWDGAKRFQGIVVGPPRDASGQSQRHQLRVEGPQHWLKKLVYKQSAVVAAAPGSVPPYMLGRLTHGLVKLYQGFNLTTGAPARLDLRGQVADALTLAVELGAPIAYVATGIPQFIYPPWDERKDAWIWDVQDIALRWTPHISSRWDHSQPLPRLEYSTGSTVNSLATTACASVRGGGRYELLVPKLTVVWVRKDGFEGVTILGTQTSNARETDAAFDSFGESVFTIELANEELLLGPVTTLASTIHTAFKELFFDLDIVLEGQYCDWSWRPGDTLQLTGAGGHLAGATGVIQTVTHDLKSGRTTIRTGPPSHLGLDDLLALLKANRLRQTPSNGSGQASAVPQETGPFKLINISDEVAKKIRVCSSTLFGDTPDGFSEGDTPPYLLTVENGDIIYACLSYDTSDGSITSRTLGSGGTLPDSEPGTLYERIGSVSVESGGPLVVANDRYGPILGTICASFDLEAGTSQYLAQVTG